jgi:hypothetical protein
VACYRQPSCSADPTAGRVLVVRLEGRSAKPMWEWWKRLRNGEVSHPRFVTVAAPVLAGSPPPEASKVLDSTLYPDLLDAGGLSPALQRIFQQLSERLRVREAISPGGACVLTGSRGSQICVALQQRAFHVDFWNQGVQYGQGWTNDLTEVGRAIEAFQVHEASTARMKSDFSWFAIGAGLLHERGADSYVADGWERLVQSVTSESQHSPRGRLEDIVLEAANRPELRQLYPFTSLARLHFSRTTGFPFTGDCPFAMPIKSARFRVMAADGKLALGEGDAVQAADMLVANLPRNCGPAIHGTAESFKA